MQGLERTGKTEPRMNADGSVWTGGETEAARVRSFCLQAAVRRVECAEVENRAGSDEAADGRGEVADSRAGTRLSLREIALAFAKVGAIGFGGGLGMLALLRQEMVARRKWVSDRQLGVGVALSQVLPGPFISNYSSYIGHELRGPRGAAVAVAALLAPSFVLMCGLSFLYFRYGSVPVVSRMFAGVQPVVVGILVWATWQMGHSHIKGWRALLIGVLAFVALLLRVDVVLVVLGAGLVNLMLTLQRGEENGGGRAQNGEQKAEQAEQGEISQEADGKTRSGERTMMLLPWFTYFGQVGPMLPSVWTRARDLLAVFLKVGALLFGGGFASIPFLQQEVVQVRHWLTMKEFIDGVALGQMTPGPVAITAAFIGYKVLGLPGAFLSTLAVFVPSFFLLWGLRHVHRRVESNPLVAGFVGGVLPAVTGILLSATVSMARTALSGPVPALVALISVLLLFRLRLDPIWLVLGGALFGLLLR